MLLGRYKTIITPDLPTRLAGFAHRTEPAREKYGELYLRTSLIQDGDTTVCFFVADIIWWDDELVEMLRRQIREEENIPEHHLHFIATHNHSGPQVSNRFSEQLGVYNKDFTEQLVEKTRESIKQVKANIEPVAIQVRKSKFDLGIYRRMLRGGKIEMAPNEFVEVDDDLTVVSFLNDKQQEIATWIHYACHPTSTDANIVSGEYPGVCTDLLEKEEENCVVSFFQGFTGDIRPRMVRDGEFYRGSLKEMITNGESLFEKIREMKKEPCEPTIGINLAVIERSIELEYDPNKLIAEIPASLYEEWSWKKDEHAVEELRFSYIQLSEHLSFLLVNAEMTQWYGQTLKRMNPHVLPTGYANGMLGYIATEKQMQNGGYEAETSIYYFAMKGKLHPHMEEKINRQIKQIQEEKQ